MPPTLKGLGDSFDIPGMKRGASWVRNTTVPIIAPKPLNEIWMAVWTNLTISKYESHELYKWKKPHLLLWETTLLAPWSRVITIARTHCRTREECNSHKPKLLEWIPNYPQPSRKHLQVDAFEWEYQNKNENIPVYLTAFWLLNASKLIPVTKTNVGTAIKALQCSYLSDRYPTSIVMACARN